MALQSSGQISFNNIKDEFGLPTNNKFGNYRVSVDIGELSNMPLDDGVPQSGQLKFSDFYNKRLNVVVDCYSGGSQSRKSAKDDKWANNNLTVIGPLTTKPANTGEGGSGDIKKNKKIIIHVNKQFHSAKSNNRQICALRTGAWDSGTTLQVDIGGEGRCYGAGGNGGDGADGKSDQGPVTGSVGAGSNGNSALGVEYSPTTINVLSGGRIRCGYGGGGGAQGARQVDGEADRTACGGGGGGGAGTPAGAAGEGGQRLSGGGDEVASGTDGGSGSATNGGAGGSGGNNANEAIGATGGVGGDSEQSPGAGGSVYNGKNAYGGNGAAGNNGAAIRRISGYTVTVNNSGTIEGGINATGVA